MRPWKLSETNYAPVKDHKYEVAVLPVGATEPHNLHLPYGTDMLEGEIVGEERMLEREFGRIRDVTVAPDGSIFLLTDEDSGAIVHITRG